MITVKSEKDIQDSFSLIYHENQSFVVESVYRLTYNRIFFIEQGSGFVQIDGVSYPVSGNEIFLLAKGQLYTFLPQTVITGYELCFGDCFWERTPASANNCKAVLFNNASANQCLPVSNVDHAEISLLFELLYKEFSGKAYINKLDALAAYLKILMIKIANINASLIEAYDSYEKQLYRRFIELVSSQYQSTHEVAEFAEQMDISARRLTDICKHCTGKGAKDIINGQLIAEAKRELQFSSLPIKEVAYKLNFSTAEQFSHFFKKNTQVSPNEYRKIFITH